jgi:pimeloyl-ACP methyl ester carboxylesterase
MEKIFNTGSCQISYEDIGYGKPVMLIHGYLETGMVWESFARKLSKRFRVIVPDLPGHGKSTLPGDVLPMELMAGIIDELAVSLGFEKFFLAGHSLGGYITLAYAELFPHRLSGYSLIHSQPFADTQESIAKRQNEISLVTLGKKDSFVPANIRRLYATSNIDKFSAMVERSIQIANSIPGETITAILRGMMLRPSRVSVIEEGECPFLWILGSMDNLINHEAVMSKVILPPYGKSVVLTGSGHMGFIEEEEKVLGLLESFMGMD